TKMTISTENNTYIKIDDCLPEIDEYQATYHNLRIIIPYTGRIRIARDFISDFLFNMGFQKPSSYKTVYDFKLDKGKIIEMKDRSEDAAIVRNYLHNTGTTHINLIKKINASFKLDFEFE
ncbi:MAG: hypothetical protein KDC88_17445, partial [Ignavibacteriae bacterium]|nr:hypothetical protein [Ignavibacteriota bacterium]